jgi:putative transcriptional regulator
MAKTTQKYESRLLRSVHRSVAGLHRLGLVDEATMREFDAQCLTAASSVAPAKVKQRS